MSEGGSCRRRTIAGVEGCEDEIHGTWRLEVVCLDFGLFTRDFPERAGWA